MGCTYTLQYPPTGFTQTFDSELALNSFLIERGKYALLPDWVFSMEASTILSNNINIIEMNVKKDAARLRLLMYKAKREYNEDGEYVVLEKPYEYVTSFLSKYRDNDGNRIVPEFIKEKYWEERFKAWHRPDGFTDEEKELIFGEGIPAPITDINIAKNWAKEIEAKWTALGKIGTELHKVLNLYFVSDALRNETDVLAIVKELRPKINTTYVPDAALVQTVQYAKRLDKYIAETFGSNAKVYSEIPISGQTTDADTKLFGVIDLLVLSNDGQVHVFDYKTSPKAYDKYNTAKVRAFKYQTSIYNRLLAKYGLTTLKSKIGILPIEIKEFHKEGDEWLYSGIEEYDKTDNFSSSVVDLTTEMLGDKNLLSKLDEFLPVRYKVDLTTENLLETNTKLMNEAFPAFELNRTISDEELDKKIEETGGYKPDAKGIYHYKVNNYGKEITAEKREDLFKKVRDFWDNLPASNLRATQAIINALKYGTENKTRDILVPKGSLLDDKGTIDWLRETILGLYCNEYWSVVDNPALEVLGIITIENNLTHQVNFLKVSTADIESVVNFGNNNHSLVGAFESDVQANKKHNSLMLEAARGNVEMMQTMFAINSMASYFAEGQKYVGDIQVINPYVSKGLPASNAELVYSYKQLASHIHIENDKISDGTILFGTKAQCGLTKFKTIMSMGEHSEWKEVGYGMKRFQSALNEFETACTTNKEEIVLALEKLVRELNTNDFNWELRKSAYNEYDHPQLALYDLILLALAEAKGINFRQQIKDHSKWLESINIVKQGISGTYIDNPGNWDSDTLNLMSKLVMEAYQNVRDDIARVLPKVLDLVLKLKDLKNFGWILERTVGNLASLYSNIIETRNNDLYIKNLAELSGAERDFAEYFLDVVNKQRYKDVYTDAQLQLMKESHDDSYYLLPLARGDKSSSIEATGFINTVKQVFSELHPRNAIESAKQKALGFFLEDTTERLKRHIDDELFQMNNMFDYGNNAVKRRDAINKVGLDKVERNLETLLLKHVVAYSMQEHINEVFPMIKASMIYLSNSGIQQNTEFTNDLELQRDYILNKIKHQSLKTGKEKTVIQALNTVKSAASKMTLAFAPVQFGYQMLEGIWKDISLIIRKPDGTDAFTFKHMTAAWNSAISDLLTLVNTNKPTKCSLINLLYGLNDMDMNVVVDKIKTDKHGLFNFWNIAYKCASRADFYNRLTIFGALMRADGCWDAHSVNSKGELVYDWKKDARFEAFANNWTSDPRYQDHKGRYYSIAQLLVNEHTRNADGTLFKIGDALPRAYSNKEAESMKSLADNLYGYYTDEKKSLIHATTVGALWMQFRTYWSGKKNLYFEHGNIKLRGRFKAKEGWFWKTDEHGNLVMTLENTGVPLYEWEGDWQEGILGTIYKIGEATASSGSLSEGIKTIWQIEDPELRRVYLANIKQLGYDLFIFATVGCWLGALLAGWGEDLKKDAKESGDFADALAASAALVAARSVANSAGDFNWIESIGGPLTSWTPFSFEFSLKFIGRLYNAAVGDSDFYDAFVKSWGATRLTQPIFDCIKPSWFDE